MRSYNQPQPDTAAAAPPRRQNTCASAERLSKTAARERAKPANAHTVNSKSAIKNCGDERNATRNSAVSASSDWFNKRVGEQKKKKKKSKKKIKQTNNNFVPARHNDQTPHDHLESQSWCVHYCVAHALLHIVVKQTTTAATTQRTRCGQRVGADQPILQLKQSVEKQQHITAHIGWIALHLQGKQTQINKNSK